MIYTIILVLVILVLGFVVTKRKYFLSYASNYKVYNENGKPLPIQIFHRSINHEYGNADSLIIEEVLLYIDDEIDMNDGKYNNGVLSIHPNTANIMSSNGGRHIFTKLGKRVLFQHDFYMTDEFRLLYNNGFNYESKNEEPIKFFIAEGNSYKFNTFAGLKAYGDTVIVEQLNGNIKKEGVYKLDK